MYGLVIESLVDYIRNEYSDDAWEEIRKMSQLPSQPFSTQQIYSESIIPTIINNACKLLNVSERNIMESVGQSFVMFVARYGYDRILSVLGRHMRDFLNGLDNLHEYLRFSYPRMRPPSFFCEDENRNGLRLHYRTKRRGFVYYTMGQIKAVGKHYYNTNIDIDIVLEELQLNTLHVVFQLHFDNTGFEDDQVVIIREEQFLPIRAHVFLDIFPFSIFFDSSLKISFLGSSLHTIMSKVIGKNIVDVFSLIRPLIDFGWVSILSRMNNIFELVALEPTLTEDRDEVIPFNANEETDREIKENKCLKLKGQMLYMEEWNGILYLGTPVMPDLDTMIETGLYINDLSMHDFSRDLMLAGTQQSVELKLALDQEHQKSKRLEEGMRKLDEEMKRTDELLYQMIPKAVADRLRKGETAVNTCEIFEAVTILFSDIVTFTEICSRITPMEVVSLLNAMYSLFDRLTEIHNVYKVETIGDAYMVVGGAPDHSHIHAQQIANMALDMLQVITGLKDPSTNDSIRIRVGMHSGTVVAGVVGVKMPRYCLFGDTVNTAARMESSGEAMKIQVSPQTKELLPEDVYHLTERGLVTVKGKGQVMTYWLTGKVNYEPPKIGATEWSLTDSPIYSPLIVGDKILRRHSIAYNALSPLTTPNSSRPTTAEVGTKAASKTGEELKSALPLVPTMPLQQRDGIAHQIPIIKEPDSVNKAGKDRQNNNERRLSLFKKDQRPPETLNPAIHNNSMALSKPDVPSSNVQSQDKVLTYQPIVMNVPPMSQGNTAVAIGDRLTSTKPSSPTGFTNNISGAVISESASRMQIEKLEASQRPYPQQVVPHVHCSLQCQSTSCELQ